MGDHSKREKRRQHVLESREQGSAPAPGMPQCACGEPAELAVDTITAVAYYCRRCLPDDALER